MNIDIFTYSNKGARSHNEDSCGVINNDQRCVAVVCDGLGGHGCGEVASQYAVRQITDGLINVGTLDNDTISSIIKNVNNGIILRQVEAPEQKGMRTTAVGCVIENNLIRYFNIGDSRFYFFTNGTLSKMTKDHSILQLSVDMGEMLFDDIRNASNQNKLLRALGNDAEGSLETVYDPVKFKKGDAFLLCSDGFWEYVLEDEMEIDLSKSETAKEWIGFMLVRLLLKFSDKNDNYTVIGGIIN